MARSPRSVPLPGGVSPAYRQLVASFVRALRAENRSPNTIEVYTRALANLAAYLLSEGLPTDPSGITRGQIQAFDAATLERHAAATAATYHGALSRWFAWLTEEGETPTSPMLRLRQPVIPEHAPAVLTEAELRRLLGTCAGVTFEARRDTAVLRLLIDTGMRVGELAGLLLTRTDGGRLTDLDLDLSVAYVLGKGRRPRVCPFGRKCALALDRYLRERSRHRHAAAAELWLGRQGPLSAMRLYDMVQRRGVQAGIPGLHPHVFRHGFASAFLRSGGQEGDLMQLAGWRSRAMLQKYGASVAAERAIEAYRSRAPGDRL